MNNIFLIIYLEIFNHFHVKYAKTFLKQFSNIVYIFGAKTLSCTFLDSTAVLFSLAKNRQQFTV